MNLVGIDLGKNSALSTMRVQSQDTIQNQEFGQFCRVQWFDKPSSQVNSWKAWDGLQHFP